MDSVNVVWFSAYSNWFLSGSADKTISMWDIWTGLSINTLYGHTGGINAFSISADEHKLVSADNEGMVHLWDLRTMKSTGEILCGPFPLNGIEIDPSGKLAFAGSDDFSVKVLDLENMKLETELKGHEDAVLDIAMNIVNWELITCSADSTFRTWGWSIS